MPQLQFDTLPALASIVSQFANAVLLGKFLLATALAGFRCNSATVEVVVSDENGLAVFGGRAASVTGEGLPLRLRPIEGSRHGPSMRAHLRRE